jgi:hypothetical protein
MFRTDLFYGPDNKICNSNSRAPNRDTYVKLVKEIE